MGRDESGLNEKRLLATCEESLFRLAVLGLEARRAEAAAREANAGSADFSADEMDAAYRASLPAVRRALRRERRRTGTRRLKQKTLPRVVTFAAGVLAVVLIGGLSALALSDGARVYLSRLLVSPTQEYTDFRFDPDATLPVPQPPEGYTGDFFPGYLPPGYELAKVFESSVIYKNAQGKPLYFDEMDFYTALGLDTEDADVTYGKVGGTDAMIVRKNGRVSILWAYTDRYFLVMIDGSLDTAMQIAESVVLIGD